MCPCGRALRGRGAAEDGDLARPDRPSRCTLPITALRVMPPSSAAIWLADSPSVHSRLSISTRSSVQVMASNPSPVGAEKSGQSPTMGRGTDALPPTPAATTIYASDLSAARYVVPADRKATIWRESGARVRPSGVHMFIHCRDLHPHLSAWMPGRPARARRHPGAPDHVDSQHRRNKIPARAARRGGTFHLKRIVPVSPNSAPASHLLPVYARVDLAFERGEGAWLIATNGERYLDFTSGVAVNALGHAHPHLVVALQEQATRLWHMSNLFRSPDGERLAARLCEQSFADLVFFANSGAEAMECAIKITRKYQAAKGHPERYRIITFEGAFHGRTLATLAATGSAKYLEGFGPPMDGFDQVPHGDLEAVKKVIGPHTAGILIEPVQGEGGVRSAPQSFFKALRQLCDEHGLLLAFDEVQTGMGRTGDLFAYERVGVTPDVMSLAKALGGGFPIGAVLATAEAASGMTPGSHGSTFGGNPLAIATANAVLDVMLKPGFFDHVQKMSLLLKQKLASVVDRYPAVLSEVRGEGLLVGGKAVVPSGDLVNALRDQKLLTVGAGDNVVRFLAPLIVTEAEIDESVQMLERACIALSGNQLKKAAG